MSAEMDTGSSGGDGTSGSTSTTTETSDSGGGTSASGALSAFYDDPDGYIRGIVLGIFVSGVFSFAGSVAGFGLGIIETIRFQLERGGAVITAQLGSVGDTFLNILIEKPLGFAGDLAASTWIFAPVASALVFALVAVMVSLIALLTYRAVVIVT